MVDVKEEVVQEINEMTDEEKAIAWSNWVRSEVNAALDIYLPVAVSSNINVEYYPKDSSNKDGVVLRIDLKFENSIDITKPRVN